MHCFHFRLASYSNTRAATASRLEMASRFTYAQECCFYFKRFKTLRALEKHKETKHPEEGGSTDTIRFFDNEENVVRVPEINFMDRRSQDYKEGYLPWLAGLTEQIMVLYILVCEVSTAFTCLF